MSLTLCIADLCRLLYFLVIVSENFLGIY